MDEDTDIEVNPDVQSELDQQHAMALMGEYPIKEVVGQCYLRCPDTGKMRIFNKVEWHGSYVPSEDTTWGGPIPWGLKPIYKNTVMVQDPEQRAVNPAKYSCRWCQLSLTQKSSLNRHEKICPAPGGPGHTRKKCRCKGLCPGQGIYTPALDGRSLRYKK